VQVDLLPWRDVTRQVADVRLQDAVAERLAMDDAQLWPWLRDPRLSRSPSRTLLAHSASWRMTVDYAKERMAFGRPIGAYQAISIRWPICWARSSAPMSASSMPLGALRGCAGGIQAAAIAKAYTSDAYCAVTQRSIQIFGAIGFTWEMANHLYFKRARANAELFGNSRTQRGRLMDMVTEKATACSTWPLETA
jgi:acyl-CoA dehydrogenase